MKGNDVDKEPFELTRNGKRWECEISLDEWPTNNEHPVIVSFRNHGKVGTKPSAEQFSALAQLKKDSKKVWKRVSSAISKDVPNRLRGMFGDDLDPESFEGSSSAGLFLSKVEIFCPNKGSCKIGFGFEWSMDEEHGYGVICEDGVVVDIGGFDRIWED